MVNGRKSTQNSLEQKSRKATLNNFEFIVKDSFTNAERVVDAIEATANLLAKNPERYPSDKYKKVNDGSFRCFTKHRYRVSYRIAKDTIKIIRIRHTCRQSKTY